MLQYADKRSFLRTPCDVTVQIKELNDSMIHGAIVGNYSKNGLYFETDSALPTGAEICLGIDNCLDEDSAIDQNQYRAKIVWFRKLENSVHHYGFGAEDTSDSIMQNSRDSEPYEGTDLRKHSRRFYPKSVLLISKRQYYKGLINNISKKGAFIELKKVISEGRIVKLVIPGTKIDNGVMLKGKVIHSSQHGIGVKFKSLLKTKTVNK